MAVQQVLFRDPVPAPSRAALTLPPRDYQRDVLDAVHAAEARGVSAQLLSLPTGAGKTMIAAYLIAERGLPAVMIVHRDELVRQSVDKLQVVNPSLTVGVVKAERDELGADITVASAQTLYNPRRLARLDEAIPTERLVISDECHHDMAVGRRQVLKGLSPRLLIGLTATAHRADNLGLGHIYQEVVAHISMLELMARGMLARLTGLRIETAVDLDEVRVRAGEFVRADLEDAVNSPARNRLVVESWQRHAAERTRTVAFCVDVRHARDLARAFREVGVEAETVIGATPPAERERLFDAFHRGELPVLTGCQVFTEGWDEPQLDCILMCRPTKSLGLYIQMVGRGARTAPGKTDCLVLDFVDNSTEHKLITLPTLAGLDGPNLEGPPEQVAQRLPGEEVRQAGEVVDLLELFTADRQIREKRAVEVNLFGQSPYLWRDVAGYWSARAGEQSWLILLPIGDGFQPHLLTAEPKQPPALTPLFDRPTPIDMATGLAEARMPRNPFTTKEARWRSRNDPPSEAQLRYARGLGIRDADGMTRAELSDAIDNAKLTRAITNLTQRGVIHAPVRPRV